MQSPRFFKGWAKPGPVLEPDRSDIPGPSHEESLDALSGDFRIFQLKDGHRFSTDDVLTAWYGSSLAPSVERALDLGSGIGSVGMIAAWRLQGARFVTIEAQSESVRLARKSAAYNGISDRYEIREGDFRTPGILNADEKFDLILGSPPYFPEDSGVHGDHPQKIACRFEMKGDVGDYCLIASRHLASGGFLSLVFPIQPGHQLEKVREGAKRAGLTIVRYRPICLREGEPPLLAVFALVASSDLPEKFRGETGLFGPGGFEEPALVIRRKDGTVHPEYSAIKLSFGFPP
jgi:tRNA1Val (adenine37-N6)-methyltransferase